MVVRPLIVGATLLVTLGVGAVGGAYFWDPLARLDERQKQAQVLEDISTQHWEQLKERRLGSAFLDRYLRHKLYESKNDLRDDQVDRDLAIYMRLAAELVQGAQFDERTLRELKGREWDNQDTYKLNFQRWFNNEYKALQEQGCPVRR